MSAAVAVPAQIASRALRMSVSAVFRFPRIGYVVLGLQLAGFLAWSATLYSRFALTSDFAVYHQAWYLIAHGYLDPYSTVWGLPFWRNDSEFALWALAPFYWIWPHDVVLLWLQDIGIVGAEAVAFRWICELTRNSRLGRNAAWLAGAGLVLLVANPWIWWAVSFDFHEEAIAIPFAVLLARDLANGRRRAWVWVIPILAAGAQTSVYVAGLGIGSMLANRRRRATGAIMACLSAAYLLLIMFIHGDQGAPIAHVYGYLAAGSAGAAPTFFGLVQGIAAHPLGVLRILWAKRVDMLANLAPAGLIGLGNSLVLPVVLAVLLSDTLVPGLNFTEPLFQAMPIYVLLPVGTVAVLGWFAGRRRRIAMVLTGLVVAQALGWAAVWAPRTAGQWLRVPAPAAATLAGIEARIPATAEVIASQGVIGPFTGRTDMRRLEGRGTIPVTHSEVWFVITPTAGIELQSTATATALIGELAGPLRATLVTHANGVWAFRWRPPPGVRALTLPDETTPLPAWAAPIAPGAVGKPITNGPAGTWRVTSAAGRGYVADGLAWQEPPGRYQALVSLSSTGPVSVEVWNDTGDVLLARQSAPATTGIEAIALRVNATTAYRARSYSGWGPFRADFVPPPAGERLEVRVWSPGGEVVNVYSAQLTPSAVGK